MSKVHVLYGSATGNAESIAQDFAEVLTGEGIENECLNLNEVKKKPLKEIASALVIVCSTTGNGDAPENAEGWWRSVKLRSAAKDMFEGLPYAVLGLGDTNYDKFAQMGKLIDKRLEELGAVRMHDLCCADEATNMEETVEEWKPAVIEKLKAQIEASSSS